MSLASLFMQLKIQAARNGSDRAMDLKGGARLAVRVRGDVVTLTISRKEKKLSDTEIITFKRDCGVPADAERLPDAGQRMRVADDVTWHCVTYRWTEETP